MKRFKEYINEDVVVAKELVNKLADYLQSKITSDFIRNDVKQTINGLSILFIRKHDANNSYEVCVNPNDEFVVNRIWLFFYESKEVSRESLADPKQTFLTTSAAYVKHKKRKLRHDYDTYNEAIKVIDRWFKS
jgi:hypothetical protein